MSDTHSSAASRLDAETRSAAGAARRESEAMRDTASRAGEALRSEGAGLADSVRRRAVEGAEEGKAAAASSLSAFTAAIRKASDELGERDQSMAAGLARQAASGLEQAAEAIEGRSVQDLTRSVADFARRQPGAFLIGAALAGVALGRFARASGDHAGPMGARHSGDDRFDDDWRRETLGTGTGTGTGTAASSSGRTGTSPKPFDASGERHGSPSSVGTATANPAAASSQGDATGLFGGTGSGDAALNRPGTSGSTGTAGLAGPSASSTGEKA